MLDVAARDLETAVNEMIELIGGSPDLVTASYWPRTNAINVGVRSAELLTPVVASRNQATDTGSDSTSSQAAGTRPLRSHPCEVRLIIRPTSRIADSPLARRHITVRHAATCSSHGVGAAIVMANSLRLIAAAYEGQKRNMPIAIFGTVLQMVGAIAPVFGGLLVTLNWRWMSPINVLA
ncbi:hypothetical protein [Nonomuraea turkmeniaca]|uniref:hypothetical protein n=1 Tax=Nonomuraea turkmeniaca TaxID=103838 RepID=UPI0014769967|nr:hypothetical protein [Nonomuraea turkmeniaca]